MTKATNIGMASALGLLLSAGLPALSFAQQDVGNIDIPSLEFQQADVREALRSLFKTVGASYTVDQDVQGTVTVDLKHVPFDTALQNVLRQIDATYRIIGGVYEIIKRQPDPITVPVPGPVPVGNGRVVRTISILHADPALIALLLAGKGSQNYGGSPEITSLGRFMNPNGGNGGGNNFGRGGGGQGNGFGNTGSGFGSGLGSGLGSNGGSGSIGGNGVRG
jgi:type II secretory pathway component GspD/PulD (secretin)